MAEAFGDFHQHAVAGLVAEAVVDQLEAIQVNEQQGGLAGAGALPALHGLLQQLAEAGAVGQASERIVARGMVQSFFRGAALADVALRAGDTPQAAAADIGDAAHQHPEVAAVAAADAVLVMEEGRQAAQVIVDGLAQAGQVVTVNAAEPALAGGREAVAVEIEHANPAFGEVQLVLLQLPFPQSVIGAAHGAGIARFAVLQRLALGGAVAVQGQADIEEHLLDQAGETVAGHRGAEQFPEQAIQVQAIGAEVPLQVDAYALVDPADAQPLQDVGLIQRALPEAAVVVGLALLETFDDGPVAKNRCWRRIIDEFLIEGIDEVLVGALDPLRTTCQTLVVDLAPVEKTQALTQLIQIWSDVLQQV